VTRDVTLARLCRDRLVVVARRLAVEHVGPVAQALVDAGVLALEITVDEPSAIETIARLHERFGSQLMVGAGTVLRKLDAEDAIAAGADFIVSPVFIRDVLKLCDGTDVLYVPGAVTPSEIFAALDAGARAVKLFPASAMTSTVIRDTLEPFRNLHPVFMLTGGLDSAKIPAYLSAGVSIFGVGGAVLAQEDLVGKQYAHIGVRAGRVLAAMKG